MVIEITKSIQGAFPGAVFHRQTLHQRRQGRWGQLWQAQAQSRSFKNPWKLKKLSAEICGELTKVKKADEDLLDIVKRAIAILEKDNAH
jgi:hypothetical protein